jgi:RsiW-degrading membrane proteinase PrsW (M82 family)
MVIQPVFFYGLLGGLLPALLWLWFFLKEDSKRPEPKWLILAAFLAGMLAVILALPPGP